MISICTGEVITLAKARVAKALESGTGYEKFCEMVHAQGGDVKVIENLTKHRRPKFIRKVKLPDSGYVSSIDTYKIGMAAVKLGAGRLSVGDKIDPLVGISVLKKIGDKVSGGDIIAIVHANHDGRSKSAIDEIMSAYKLSETKPEKPELVIERVG